MVPTTPAQRRDLAIADLSARQHGVIARWQLLALGLSPSGIARRVAHGRLHVIHAGVYAVGHRVLRVEGRFMAAVLACGDGAALSHRSAAELLGIRRTDAARIDVIVLGRRSRVHPGIAVHRPRRLEADELTRHDGIPVTTPERTLLDLGDILNPRQLERACEAAEQARLLDWSRLQELVDRYPGKLGSRRLRRLLGTYAIGEDRTRSGLERRFLAFCAQHGIPAPAVNSVVEGDEVDCSWPVARLIVEADTHATHGSHAAFERDRRRDARLTAAGWRVVRVTPDRLARDPGTLARELRALLSAR